MNVYDFDGTILSSDCSIGFCIWCMNRHPKLWFTFAPKAIKNLIMAKKGKMPEYLMQRTFFSYLTLIDDFDEQIERYWDKNEKKIAADPDAETMEKVKKKNNTGWNIHLKE